MLGDIGNILVGLSLLTALYSAFAGVWSLRQRDPRWSESARNALYAVPMLLGIALLILTIAFLDNRFELNYVAQHSSRALPGYLKLSAVWAGQEGSLLLWAFLQGLFAAIAVAAPSKASRPLVPWASVFLNLITAFFTAVTLLLSNPFVQAQIMPPDGVGLNPLLRHPGMIFHPPAMYVGYVGVAVPFAFALAALVSRQVENWTSATRTWTLVAWLGLGLGLLLGMRWAYDVLGWGGYWGWDPVENAGLMPWLTTTALLHSAVMQEERRGFRAWNLALIIASFVLVLFGTFATRSGAIQSVHAYARSNIGSYFLAAIIVSLIGSVAVLIWRRRDLNTPPQNESLLSRDGLFFITLILFSTLTISVFVGSVLPTLTDALSGRKFEAGPEWFDRVTGPQLGLLVLIIGLCPLIGRAAAAFRRLNTWKWPILAGALIVPAIAALSGFTSAVSLVGFALVGLAGTTALVEYAEGAWARHRRTREPILNALWTLIRTQRRKYGGYLVHIGVVLMAVGIIGTRMYPMEEQIVARPGQSTEVANYTLFVEELKRESVGDYVSTWSNVAVYRDQTYLATLQPRLNQFPNFGEQLSVPALQPGLREDLYLILAGWGDNGAEVTFKVLINPLINFLWFGGLVFMAGGALAVWPKPDQKKIGNLIGGALIILLLIGAGYAMWGLPHGTLKEVSGRPLVGQAAPDVRLTLLDGTTFTKSDLAAGNITLLNFWAHWCPSCKEELPALEAAWQAYQDRGVRFVGIAYQSTAADTQASIEEYGLTFPSGLDDGDRLAAAYGITGVPETFIIDGEGRVAYTHIGPISYEEVAAELDALLAKETP